jgi:hypothetical protein
LVTQVGHGPFLLFCSNTLFADSKITAGPRVLPTSMRSSQCP